MAVLAPQSLCQVHPGGSSSGRASALTTYHTRRDAMSERRSPFVTRRFFAATLIGAVILTLAIVGLVLASPSDSLRPGQVTVKMADFTYVPNVITVRAGTRVRWLNTGGVA